MVGKSAEGARPTREDIDYSVADKDWVRLATEGPPTPRLVQQKYVPGTTRGFETVGSGRYTRRVIKVSGSLDEGNMNAILDNLKALTGFSPPAESG